MTSGRISRAEANLRGWLREYRMESHFPDLSEAPALRIDSEIDKVFLREGGEEIISILTRVRHATRTLVRFTAGHGTTTFAQSVAKRGRDFNNGIYLFVEPLRKRNQLGGFADELARSGTPRVLSEALLEALLDRNYEDLLYNGRALYFDILSVPDSSDLNFYRNCKLVNEEPQEFRDWFESTAARLSNDFLGTVEKLHAEANMSTIVCFDLPHTAEDDLIGEVVRSMKWIEESKRNGYPGMALLEVYFTSHDVANVMIDKWPADYQEITIAPYSQSDVFLILSQRYKPMRLGQSVPLNTILSEAFLTGAYREDEPLAVILKRMRMLLEKACDTPREQIKPALSPK